LEPLGGALLGSFRPALPGRRAPIPAARRDLRGERRPVATGAVEGATDRGSGDLDECGFVESRGIQAAWVRIKWNELKFHVFFSTGIAQDDPKLRQHMFMDVFLAS